MGLKRAFHIHHWEAHANAVQQLPLGALHHRGDVLLRHCSAHNRVLKFEAFTRVWLVDHAQLGILSRATCLLLVGVPQLYWLGNRLAVGHLGQQNGSYFFGPRKG